MPPRLQAIIKGAMEERQGVGGREGGAGERDEGAAERKTPWHTGLMKAMNHSLVFKEHISGVINSAQRPRPG